MSFGPGAGGGVVVVVGGGVVVVGGGVVSSAAAEPLSTAKRASEQAQIAMAGTRRIAPECSGGPGRTA
jgi:hypothetical protein